MQEAFQQVALCSSLHTVSVPDSCSKLACPWDPSQAPAGCNMCQCWASRNKQTSNLQREEGFLLWGNLGDTALKLLFHVGLYASDFFTSESYRKTLRMERLVFPVSALSVPWKVALTSES